MALRQWLGKVKALIGKKGGRPPQKLRIALQCVLGAIASKAPELANPNVSMGSVADVLDLGRHDKRRLEERAEQ
eukprot:2497582-Pleurochrysis_carterae.AAC.1